MKSSELVLSKPGGLTSTEIAMLGIPFIHTMPIPGCENYNANFFSQRGMSIQCNTLQKVVDNTKKLLENKELQEKLVQNQKNYMNKNVCEDIVNIIIRECDSV